MFNSLATLCSVRLPRSRNLRNACSLNSGGVWISVHVCRSSGASALKKGGDNQSDTGGVRGNEFDQRSPRHHLVHLLKEHLLACFLYAEIGVQDGLFHRQYFLKLGLHQAHSRRSYAEFPQGNPRKYLVR
jgi:hypothetical protein